MWALSWVAGAGLAVAFALPAGIWIASGVYWAGTTIAIALGPRPSWGRRPPIVALVAIGVASAIAVLLAAVAIARVFDLGPALAVWRGWGLEVPVAWAWCACYVLLNPILEEGYWRGTLGDGDLGRRFGRRRMAAVAAVGFAGHHAATLVASMGWVAGGAACVPIVGAGIAWAWMRERSGGLWWPVATHFGVDLGLVLAWGWLAR